MCGNIRLVIQFHLYNKVTSARNGGREENYGGSHFYVLSLLLGILSGTLVDMFSLAGDFTRVVAGAMTNFTEWKLLDMGCCLSVHVVGICS
jgi:hypothetical protein